jgi:hypothetical protein
MVPAHRARVTRFRDRQKQRDARGARGRHVGLWRGFTSASLAMAGRFLARAARAAREPKYRLEEQL